MRLHRFVVLACIAAAACGGANVCKQQTLLVAISFDDTTVAADTLTVSVAIAGADAIERTIAHASGTRTGTLEIDFPHGYPSGNEVVVSVEALAAGVVLGSGSSSATLAKSCSTLGIAVVGSGITDVDMADDLASDDMQQAVSVDMMPGVAVSPLTATVRTVWTQKFTADRSVVWTVSEGPSGGQIDQTGIYTAPATPGVYHVVATSQADATHVGTATVTVTQSTLDVLAGQPGGGGNINGVGVRARFTDPIAVAYRNGVVYVGDAFNYCIRAIATTGLTAGTVTNLAGKCDGTYGNVDGIGPTAIMSRPMAIAVDNAGNLYFSDIDNFTIRKVVLATGAVTTLAGDPTASGSTDGVGSAAKFDFVEGLVTDDAGDVYIGDAQAYTVRKLVVATRTVSTIAGAPDVSGSVDATGGAARFGGPCGLAYDGTDTLYIADSGNNTIRKMLLSTGAVTTIAGTAGATGTTDGVGAAARFNVPLSVTLSGTALYVADDGNELVRRIDLGTNNVTTVAGGAGMTGTTDGAGTSARFNEPMSVAFDASFNAYVADSKNNTIRQISAAGNVATYAGSVSHSGYADGTATAALFTRPHGVAVDDTGNIFIADQGNNRVRQVSLTTAAVTTLAGGGSGFDSDGTGSAASFGTLQGVAVDNAGHVFVSDQYNSDIRQIVIATGAATHLAGHYGGGSNDGTGAAAGFAQPAGMAVDGGYLYVADSGNDTVRRIEIASGIVTTFAGSAGFQGSADGIGAAAQFFTPVGIAADHAGSLYVTDQTNCLVRKIDIATANVTTLAGAAKMCVTPIDGVGSAARFQRPEDITVDSNGNAYVIDKGRVVRRIVLASGAVSTFLGSVSLQGVKLGPLPAAMSYAGGLAMTKANDLLLTDVNENVLVLVH